jgi:hypothetical protein
MRILLTAWGVALAGLFSGCAPTASPPPPVQAAVPAHQPQEEAPGTAEDPRYVDAVTAFRAGDMDVAASLFVQVREASLDEPTRRRALYGLACARLIAAQDEKELAKARSLWETWRTESPPGGDGEDPKFMAAVLTQYRPAFLLKDMKAACEKECDKRLLEKEEEVRRIIQRQVQALEEIHRQIQEKKKGLSSY